jgi:positive regulator of sigma E activity
MSADDMCSEKFDASEYHARARYAGTECLHDSGVVTSIQNGIAYVELPRNSACGKCGMCACGTTRDTILIAANAREDTHVGDRVRVAVNRRMRGRAQMWLLAFPLLVFLGAALGASQGLRLSDGMSFLIGIVALGGAFALVWHIDRRRKWSAGAVAEIVDEHAVASG